MTHPVIKAEHVCFAYDQRPILADVSLTIDKGEFVGLIGPNGGGKTTLFRLILGFLTPTSGQLSLFDLPPTQGRKRTGYVPQNLRFDRAFPLTVLELVLSGCLFSVPWHGRYTPAQKEAARQALAQVQMEDHCHASFAALSGGQAQRVLMARALVSQPELLLLDEPTANVDARAEADLLNLLDELKGSVTILLVTHNFEVATHRVDRVLCVQNRVDPLKREQVCEHFGIGIYHAPLTTKEPSQ